MEEWVDVLDEEGNYTGKSVLKSEAHAQGLFHPTVHIWCYTAKGKVLLQQRGANKSMFPLKWDVSVAGHIAAGEKIEVAALREVAEEIGVTLSPQQLRKVGVFKTCHTHSKQLIDNEFNHTFLCVLEEDTSLIKQDSEVQALAWVSLSDFKSMVVQGDNKLISAAKERHLSIIELIEKEFTTNQ